jgi:prophage DNA circulation protein
MNIEGISTSQAAPAGSYWAQLRPASYRGVPFGVFGGQARFGRRNALHEYPFRDTPWVEDLGRSSRRITVTGFLVGDDVIAQRERLITACEKPGDGELIHPTLGRLKVSLMEVSTAEHWEQARVFEINFSFVEQGERQFPDAVVTPTDAISSAASTVSAAAGDTHAEQITKVIKQRVIPQVSVVTAIWTVAATAAGKNATSLINLAASLQGNYGRLLGQSSGISLSEVVSSSDTIAKLTGKAASSRASIAAAVAILDKAGLNVSVSTLGAFSQAARDLASAVRGASPTPADGVRSMLALTTVRSVVNVSQQATADLFRRIAVAGLAQASAAYQPSTSDEATQVRTQVLDAIDAEITTAGNQGDDSVYTALRTMRAEVIRDMNAKGASLPTLITVTTQAPLPALTLAQKLYRDPNREEELVRRANPRHPAFMPLSFTAVSA